MLQGGSTKCLVAVDRMLESILRKGVDNLRFALNLDGYVPEHIIQELRSEQTFLDRNKNLGEIDKSIFDSGQIFPQLGPKLWPKSAHGSSTQKEILFDDIFGFEDLKELLTKCLAIKDSCNVLLSGPPASSKTIFLLSIQKEVSNTCFIDAANASGLG
jgi:hypothetical protein